MVHISTKGRKLHLYFSITHWCICSMHSSRDEKSNQTITKAQSYFISLCALVEILDKSTLLTLDLGKVGEGLTLLPHEKRDTKPGCVFVICIFT